MITLTDYSNKILIESGDTSYMSSVIMKGNVSQVSLNVEQDYIIIHNSTQRYIITYLAIEAAQRTELNNNSNLDLFNYFNSIL